MQFKANVDILVGEDQYWNLVTDGVIGGGGVASQDRLLFTPS